MDYSVNYKKLGKRIKEERLKSKMTQEELAEKIALSSVYISHMECGTAKPSLETLVKVCNALDVTIDYVLMDSLHQAKEYIHDEIAGLIKDCSDEQLRVIARLIKAYIQ
ncbi:helix-turn-helix transcriptional regulator [Petroclostridium sp. X23]|uniref:helix-turn-helix domain-containing protein n=1 Tax=Petroclostridium sp. X23 TaxID=3045146 RepID=UPI0024AE3BEF|nr:helix-turn-helix transcriptional regulator [Petroclostridium sp. X23]WHH57179.1 helix-turn-helix transcriptional regulator [Petroclostridium sp. X23]